MHLEAHEIIDFYYVSVPTEEPLQIQQRKIMLTRRKSILR